MIASHFVPRLLAVLLGALIVVSPAAAEHWPGWRGPRGDGTSTEKGFPLQWSETENVTWKTPIPGWGHSSPVVWGERVFVTSCIEESQERVLICVDRNSGKPLWQQTVLVAPLEEKHRLNSYASSTPATDGKYVWVSFLAESKIIVACYDVDGNKIWETSPGEFYSKHGFCSPPILYKDTVIINGDQDALAYLVALKQSTGDEVWRTDRPNRTRSYCPPLIVEAAGKTQMVLSGSKCVASYNPDTGEQYWIIDGPTEQYVASLVYEGGILFMTGGFPTYHLMAIRPDGKGNVTDTHVLWHHQKEASYVPSPIAFGDNFFVVTDNGFVMCLDVQSGERHWKERLARHHTSSPVATADGYLLFPEDEGMTFIIKAGNEFEMVAENRIADEIYSSPALSEGQVFLRGLTSLYCIGKRIPSRTVER